MEEKERTLSPEIQLLNRLWRAPDAAARAALFAAAGDVLHSGAFLVLVARMVAKVGGNEGFAKRPLLGRGHRL